MEDLWKVGVPTDKDLLRLLPEMTLEERIETIIRKYIGGAVSSAYDGNRTARDAHRQAAKYLVRKMRPWLPKDGGKANG